MRTRMQAMVLALIMAAGPFLAPMPVAADDWLRCLGDCAVEFYGGDVYTTSLRGWCYIIRCTGV